MLIIPFPLFLDRIAENGGKLKQQFFQVARIKNNHRRGVVFYSNNIPFLVVISRRDLSFSDFFRSLPWLKACWTIFL
jgi:hypothetical protein